MRHGGLMRHVTSHLLTRRFRRHRCVPRLLHPARCARRVISASDATSPNSSTASVVRRACALAPVLTPTLAAVTHSSGRAQSITQHPVTWQPVPCTHRTSTTSTTQSIAAAVGIVVGVPIGTAVWRRRSVRRTRTAATKPRGVRTSVRRTRVGCARRVRIADPIGVAICITTSISIPITTCTAFSVNVAICVSICTWRPSPMPVAVGGERVGSAGPAPECPLLLLHPGAVAGMPLER
mmetsp:Transcript_24134/g.48259  ORF Transcript_24134/g.48259 Transcript_24134/m.48259 type:complete len:237 (-) Transcript_24134:222-932(-)